MGRREASGTINLGGERHKSSVTNTTTLVVRKDAGSKLEKARAKGIPVMIDKSF